MSRSRSGGSARMPVAFALASLVLILGGPALAQDDAFSDEAEVEVNSESVPVFPDSTFYAMAFGPLTKRGVDLSEGFIRAELEHRLNVETLSLDRICRFTQEQKAKLTLAGHGDIKRFFDQVAVKKRRFDQLKFDRQNIHLILREVQPLGHRANWGLFDDTSLWRKAVNTFLNDTQARATDRDCDENPAVRMHRFNINEIVMSYDRLFGFSADRRGRLEDLLTSEIRPPRRVTGKHEHQIIMYQLARMPRALVRQVFDDVQWKLVNQHLDGALKFERELFAARVVPNGIQPLEPRNWPTSTELPTKVFMDDPEGER